MKNINSNEYWNDRFKQDWEDYQGPKQTQFFTNLAIDNLPQWILDQLSQNCLTLVDWGCAQGDGTDIWRKHVKPSHLFGVDFSETAITQAQEQYPGINFLSENWLENKSASKTYDILYSSNTLEHFHDSLDVLNKLTQYTDKAIILALPYRESNRLDEHFSSFFPSNLPLELDNNFCLIWSRVVDCKTLKDTMWIGEQIFLIYVKQDWISSLNLNLSNCLIEHSDSAQEIKNLSIQLKISEQNLNASKEELKISEEKLLENIQDLQESQIELCTIKQKLKNIHSSSSWKITKPMRMLGDFIKSSISFSYQTARFIYRNLPQSIKQHLDKYKNKFIKNIHPYLSNIGDNKILPTDLTWSEFKHQILSDRQKYKGVFIQQESIDWNVPLYQRPQHITTALGKLGYLVIYKTYDLSGNDHINGFREIYPNVWLTNKVEVDTILGTVSSVYSTALRISPSIFKQHNDNKYFYEYIDHIDEAISGNENVDGLIKLKESAFANADYIVASAQKLYDEAVEAVGKDRVIFAQNGVDTDHYRNPIHETTEVSQKLLDFCHKHNIIIGYFGALAPWLWYELIRDIATKRPDIGFVYIGPDYHGGSKQLPKTENLLYLGVIDYKILPAYAKYFDICFIPFKPGEIAQTTSPLKLFEYFALEKPVIVTSDMRECIIYPEVFHGNSLEEINDAIDKAIAIKDDEAYKTRLAQLADENSWLERAKLLEVMF